MNNIGKPERVTQKRVIALFRDELGYRYLGDRSDRVNNSNIEEDLLSAHLIQVGYTMAQIGRAIHLLRVEAENPNHSLYENNKAVYSMLRYGLPVKIEADKVTETVKLIDWKNPDANDFVIVQEVWLPEQPAIATVLSDLDQDLAALEQQRDKTRALKQGMMQELLTERKRLA